MKIDKLETNLKILFICLPLYLCGCSNLIGAPDHSQKASQRIAPDACQPITLSSTEILAAVQPASTFVEAMQNAKTALEHCYLTRDEFFSDDVLTAYFGAQQITRDPPGPGYDGVNIATNSPYGFHIGRLRTLRSQANEDSEVRVSFSAYGAENVRLKISDIRQLFGSNYEARDFYKDASYTHGEPVPIPAVTGLMGNKEILYRLPTGKDFSSDIRIRFLGDGVVQSISINQLRK